jgi:ACS family tartrate transporter-like MFS transporter
MLLYFVAFIDRVNIGFASFTMNKAAGLSPADFGFGAGIFFVGYFLCEIPSNLILHRVGARRWIARVMITWSVISGAMIFVRGPTSFFTLRFLLGVAEAGFFPGIILYLGYWFPQRRRAVVTGWFMAAAPASTALGSLLSGALVQIHSFAGLAGWQLMFLSESIPALMLGVAVLFFLTDSPADASWLNDEERSWLTHTMKAEQAATAPVSHESVWRGLADLRVILLCLVYFGTSAGFYTVGIWAPQIVKSLGLTTTQVSIVTAAPAALAVVAMLLWARHSDRTGERRWHIAAPCALAAIGFLLAATMTGLWSILLALTLMNIGIGASKPPLWSIPTLFLSGPAAAAGLAAINSVGNLGGFAGPSLIGWLRGLSGSFSYGLAFIAALLLASAFLILMIARTNSSLHQAPKETEHA